MFPVYLVKLLLLNTFSKREVSAVVPVTANTPGAAKAAAFHSFCHVSAKVLTLDGELRMVRPEFDLLHAEIIEVVDENLAVVREGLL